MIHNHLSFLQHGENKLELSFPKIGVFSADGASSHDDRLPIQKHADIVDYLQRISREIRVRNSVKHYTIISCKITYTYRVQVTAIDILRDCHVDVDGKDYAVLDMLKNNPKIDVSNEDGQLFLQYRAKFEIK